MNNCPNFYQCNAPICPIAVGGGEIFYHFENICRRKGIQADHKFLKTQKKLSKYIKHDTDIGYFDVNMLNKTKRITSKTIGCDPDRPGRKFRGGIK